MHYCNNCASLCAGDVGYIDMAYLSTLIFELVCIQGMCIV